MPRQSGVPWSSQTWTLRLDPKAAKIGKGRVLAVEGPLREIIERRLRPGGSIARSSSTA
jgi:hypothetical protein